MTVVLSLAIGCAALLGIRALERRHLGDLGWGVWAVIAAAAWWSQPSWLGLLWVAVPAWLAADYHYHYRKARP